ISSVPRLQQGWLDSACARGADGLPVLSQPAAEGAGLCSFLDRCSQRIDGVCNRLPPPRQPLPNGGNMLCHQSTAVLISQQASLTCFEEVA
ncbi:MAG TPA: ABC transporter, partial [Pseudoduganella sp.]